MLELRALGHDVVTSYEAGNANQAIPDPEVLAFAAVQDRILVTYNRRHFLQLHRQQKVAHAGILLCSVDLDYAGQAQRHPRGVDPGSCKFDRADQPPALMIFVGLTIEEA